MNLQYPEKRKVTPGWMIAVALSGISMLAVTTVSLAKSIDGDFANDGRIDKTIANPAIRFFNIAPMPFPLAFEYIGT
jgi:hypothetical protein